MTKLGLLAGAALLALGACGERDAASGGQRNTAVDTAEAAHLSPAPTENAASRSLLLDADGLLTRGTDESRVSFGANSLDTIEQVTALLGGT